MNIEKVWISLLSRYVHYHDIYQASYRDSDSATIAQHYNLVELWENVRKRAKERNRA